MTFTPTAEQVAIVTAGTDTKDNLLVSALAGAAKTSTLFLLAQALPKENIICLAFNKAIALEMQERLPANCQALTINSLGHRVWGQHLNVRRLNLVKSKNYGIVKNLIDELSQADKTFAWEEFSYMLQACDHAKSSGHLPDKFVENTKRCPEPLMDDAALINSLDEFIDPLVQDLIIRALNISAVQSMEGTIDFGDQVLFPSLFRCMYPMNSLVLVDEAQDLSPLNHHMLSKLVKRRIIAVGDSCQAIYGFRGASASGMADIKEQFDMKELHLSCSFRCPEEIVAHVRWRAPHMTSFAGTPAGSVKFLKQWDTSIIPDGAAVICRNNAPILSLGVQLLKDGRYPNIWGNDIAAGLKKKLEKLGPANMLQEHAITALTEYHEEQKKRVKNHKRLQDTIDCLRIFIDEGSTLGEAIRYADTLFNSQGKIELMTGHKSKGHEFDNVFFLDEKLVGKDDQEPNLRYVICTRAKRNLTYITSDGLPQEELEGVE